MKNLYIDFDGVILNTIEVADELFKISVLNDADEFYTSLDWCKVIKDSMQINDSIPSIKKIIESGKFDVSILTHINSVDEAVEKIKYLTTYFNDITIIPVPYGVSKTKMVHTNDAILIDDSLSNLNEWKSENGISILFDSKEVPSTYPVIHKLDEIIDMF